MSGREILIGTRGSALALAQARLVAEAFEREGRPTRLIIVETAGDRRAPDTAWGEGAFVAAIERSLLRGQVDVAVHSAKDIPGHEDERLRIAAYLPRGDPRDALVVREASPARSLDALRRGARVGTDSPRRVGFVLARRPDLRLHPLHGNVDTRLRRLDAGETDALILAAVGLDRLGRGDRIGERLDPELVPPAPGQAAIAVQIRRDDARMLGLAASIDHSPTRLAVNTERAFLTASGGGCRAPIGALAVSEDGEVVLFGGYTAPDGSATAFGRTRGPVSDATELAHQLAADLRTRLPPTIGGAPRSARASALPSRRRVLVTRAAGQAATLLEALRDVGLEPLHVPSISIVPATGRDLDAAVRDLGRYDWAVVTSANGARSIVSAARRLSGLAGDHAGPRWAAVGKATARVLREEGLRADFEPSEASAAAIAQELPVSEGSRVLIVSGDLAEGDLPAGLRARGADVHEVVAYRTREAPDTSRALLREAAGRRPDAALFTSGSTVRGLAALATAEGIDVLSIPAICIGPRTSAEARLAGFRVIAEAPMRDAAALAAATVEALAQQQEVV